MTFRVNRGVFHVLPVKEMISHFAEEWRELVKAPFSSSFPFEKKMFVCRVQKTSGQAQLVGALSG
jgi:hypothetical protein